MGGAGGLTCLSGDAIDQLKDAQTKAREWDDNRRESMILETQLAAHGLALQVQGVIPMHTESEWIFQSIERIDPESLR